MATPRVLARAPIAEAVVDFRAHANAPLEAGLPRLQGALGEGSPKPEEIREFGGRLVFRKGEPPLQASGDLGLHGYRVQSSDQKDVFQFRKDGFTYNRLPPYTSGQELVDAALRLWPLYVEIAGPTRVNRIAMRYINRMPLATADEFKALLVSAPKGAPGAPGDVDTFFQRVVTLDRSSGFGVIVATGMERIVSGAFALIVDIDAYRTGEFSVEDVDALRAGFAKLRGLKNAAFFGSITDEAVAKYAEGS